MKTSRLSLDLLSKTWAVQSKGGFVSTITSGMKTYPRFHMNSHKKSPHLVEIAKWKKARGRRYGKIQHLNTPLESIPDPAFITVADLPLAFQTGSDQFSSDKMMWSQLCAKLKSVRSIIPINDLSTCLHYLERANYRNTDLLQLVQRDISHDLDKLSTVDTVNILTAYLNFNCYNKSFLSTVSKHLIHACDASELSIEHVCRLVEASTSVNYMNPKLVEHLVNRLVALVAAEANISADDFACVSHGVSTLLSKSLSSLPSRLQLSEARLEMDQAMQEYHTVDPETKQRKLTLAGVRDATQKKIASLGLTRRDIFPPNTPTRNLLHQLPKVISVEEARAIQGEPAIWTNVAHALAASVPDPSRLPTLDVLAVHAPAYFSLFDLVNQHAELLSRTPHPNSKYTPRSTQKLEEATKFSQAAAGQADQGTDAPSSTTNTTSSSSSPDVISASVAFRALQADMDSKRETFFNTAAFSIEGASYRVGDLPKVLRLSPQSIKNATPVPRGWSSYLKEHLGGEAKAVVFNEDGNYEVVSVDVGSSERVVLNGANPALRPEYRDALSRLRDEYFQTRDGREEKALEDFYNHNVEFPGADADLVGVSSRSDGSLMSQQIRSLKLENRHRLSLRNKARHARVASEMIEEEEERTGSAEGSADYEGEGHGSSAAFNQDGVVKKPKVLDTVGDDFDIEEPSTANETANSNATKTTRRSRRSAPPNSTASSSSPPQADLWATPEEEIDAYSWVDPRLQVASKQRNILSELRKAASNIDAYSKNHIIPPAVFVTETGTRDARTAFAVNISNIAVGATKAFSAAANPSSSSSPSLEAETFVTPGMQRLVASLADAIVRTQARDMTPEGIVAASQLIVGRGYWIMQACWPPLASNSDAELAASMQSVAGTKYMISQPEREALAYLGFEAVRQGASVSREQRLAVKLNLKAAGVKVAYLDEARF